MSEFSEKMRAHWEKFETPFTIKHAETHLIFGPLARHFPAAYVAIALLAISVIAGALNIFIGIILLPGMVTLLALTRRQQAIAAWAAVKFGLLFGGFMMLMIGGFGGLTQGHRDALPDLFLGLIWIPSIEFIPKITPRQKYVTIARLLLSIPCVYFGVRSGDWH